MTTDQETLQVAIRTVLDSDHVLWTSTPFSTVDGTLVPVVQLVTTNQVAPVYVRPVLTEKAVGVELVDAEGTMLTGQYRHRFTGVQAGWMPAYTEPEVDPDELLQKIRTLADDDGSPLAILIKQLDQHLMVGGGLPDDWITPDYDSWGEDA